MLASFNAVPAWGFVLAFLVAGFVVMVVHGVMDAQHGAPDDEDQNTPAG